MIAKNCGGRVPSHGAPTPADAAILAAAAGLLDEIRPLMDSQQINRALDAVWRVIADANRYFAAEAPWALKKTDPARMETVLWTTAEIVRRVAILAQFVMPGSAGRLLDQLGVPAAARAFADLSRELDSGSLLPEPQGVFPRWVGDKA
jgi:methionyl-tRNA synthetase